MNLWFRKPQHEDPLCSWAIVREQLIKACKALGYTAQADDPHQFPQFAWDWIEVWWGAPQDWEWSGRDVKCKIGITLSESDQLLFAGQGNALRNLKQADLLFVPTESSKRAFLEMPLDDVPLHLWPFGVDTQIFFPRSPNFNDPIFRFLHLGITQYRKGSWMVPEAFVSAFHRDEGAQLTIATYTESEMYTSLKREYGTHPSISFVCRRESDPSRHYEGHHVFISPHLAEGWGLCIPEAMAMGMACIVSRCSAPRDYFKESFGWFCEMSNEYTPVSPCLENTSGFWRLPDIDSLTERMRYAFDHRKAVEEKAKNAFGYADTRLNWSVGAVSALEVVQKYVNEN